MGENLTAHEHFATILLKMKVYDINNYSGMGKIRQQVIKYI